MGDPRDEDKDKETPPQVTPPPISVTSSISREEHLASLDTLKFSMRLEMKAMFEEYLGKKSPRPTNPNTTPSVDLPLAKVKPSNHGSPSIENNSALPKENDGPTKGAFIPSPNTYSILPVHYPMTHINNMGSPPKLDSHNFIKWQGLMKPHISSSYTHLWRVIQNGFAPHDPLNLTEREEVDEQLNATTKHLIQQVVSDTHVAHINNLSTAKEVWDYLI
jgi:hypothetical protein